MLPLLEFGWKWFLCFSLAKHVVTNMTSMSELMLCTPEIFSLCYLVKVMSSV